MSVCGHKQFRDRKYLWKSKRSANVRVQLDEGTPIPQDSYSRRGGIVLTVASIDDFQPQDLAIKVH
jgi:hypothetical protein